MNCLKKKIKKIPLEKKFITRSIILFWRECDNLNVNRRTKFNFWHIDRRFCHASIVRLDSKGEAVVISLGGRHDSVRVVRRDRGMTDDEYFYSLFDDLGILMTQSNASEIYAVESYLESAGFGSSAFYSCHTLVRDLAMLDIGFVINPLHLRYKLLKHDGEGYKIMGVKNG